MLNLVALLVKVAFCLVDGGCFSILVTEIVLTYDIIDASSEICTTGIIEYSVTVG